MPSLILSYW